MLAVYTREDQPINQYITTVRKSSDKTKNHVTLQGNNSIIQQFIEGCQMNVLSYMSKSWAYTTKKKPTKYNYCLMFNWFLYTIISRNKHQARYFLKCLIFKILVWVLLFS